ncbi:MAG: endonuclease VII domain-containing protein, partial [Gammaproteobacteria bacterium]|nr:endonuclease VII domain-containing protein [Gammaproteobacteria bacterium]
AVDHNHRTGFCRGLLCPFCNTMLLKYLRDNKALARGLVAYLQDALHNDIDWE